ncbi:conserved hypothetical protein [Culex quinquefasciatus]|uniref:Uncharacterized protein n=1 Tax=Culex quinquefasciatus TaxID=7176 RepID=B0WQE4_CULQU|nr:conserved hypothetical protein [Culex quinquefasciatus]|eukprot:XP_001850928.1 conserved hypothetical protein [Culex quinquefasciatus]
MSALAEVFDRVKPLVESVLRDRRVSDIRQLNAQLQRIDAASLQILQNVLLQQLVVAVDNVASGENGNEVKTALMECVGTILEKGTIRQAVVMKTTLVILLKQLYDLQGNQLVVDLSEEYKLAALRGLTLAAKNVQSELIEEVYTRDQLNLLSQVLFVAVSVLSGGDRYRKLRLQAIECVLAVLQVHDGSDFGDAVLRCQVAELMFIVLPKLLVALVSVVNGDEKQGKALVRAGVKGLGRVLGLIFEDYDKTLIDEEFSTEEFVKLSKEMGTSGGTGKNVLGMGLRDSKVREAYFSNTTRSREWLLEAEKKVHGVLTTICHLRGAEDESVRLEYARMNAELLEKCLLNMPTCSVLFLESILALCQDESPKIRSICDTTLKATSAHHSIAFGTTRKDELFYEALKTIPRSIYRGQETDQIAHFRLLIGYVHFLSDSQLQVILANQEILNQLVAILVAGAELDQPEELVRREYVSYRFRYVPDECQLEKEKRESRWIVLRNFHGSERSQKVFLQVLHAFRERPEALAMILNYILEDLFTTKLNTNGYLFLLSELVPTSSSSPTLTAIFRNVFTEILQSYHWDLDLEETTEIGNLKFNVLHICLSLRLVAKFAKFFNGVDFHFQLYDILRHVLPLSGSNLNCVNEAAELTLEAVAEPDSIQQLISTNLDYISQHISHCLRRPESCPGGVHLLESVLRFVPYESSAVLESTISPIVVSILDGHDQRRTKGILCLRVLQIFVRAIRYRYHSEIDEPVPDPEQAVAQAKLHERIAQLKEELANKLPPAGATIEEIPDEELPPEEPMDDQEEGPYQSEEDKLPPHIRITLKILTVNFKYLSSTAPEERIVALGTLTEGIHLLKAHENQLLPLVHQIWYNFAERFADPSPVVVGAAFDLLVTLAKLARDFIRKRTLDDILPRLSAFMTDHVAADFGAHQTYKLQRKVLERGAELVRWLRLNERQLDQVLNVARLYRERSERRELRELAGKMFEDVAARYDPGAMIDQGLGI